MSKKKRKKKTRSAESIALCMIVKNGEANLARCLESVKELVSEINVVDTGSTDGTVQIARRFGGRIREERWANDFSRARNVSLRMASTDWILVLDADEVLSPEAIPKIKAAILDRDVTGYTLPTRNYMNDSAVANFVPNDGRYELASSVEGWVESRKVRLFRKLAGIRFEGEVHEVVGPSIRRSGRRVEFLDAVVHHFGYLASKDSLREKNEAMVRMAEAKCNRESGNFKAHYELGIILASLGNLERAEEFLRKSVALKNDFALAHYDLGVILSRAGREEEAAFEYEAALQFDPSNPDAMNNLADSLQRLRRDEQAERLYRTLLAKHPTYKRSWSNLGALLARTGRLKEAEEAFNKALCLDPDFCDARQNIEKLQCVKPKGSRGNALPQGKTHLRQGISLCMIVRNEEDDLPGLLEEAKRFVDEIIVVDTGSSDNTRSVAEDCGAAVYEIPWINDFAAARNFSLNKAACEWILVLDADERLRTEDFAAFRELTRKTRALGISFETRNYSCVSSLEGWRPVLEVDEMSRSFPGWIPSEKVRLFRNMPSIRFEGAIHELVEPSITRMGGTIERTSVPVHHYGYDQTADRAEAYLIPAMDKVNTRPQNSQAHFELGSVFYQAGRFDEACASLRNAVEIAPENAEYLVALGDSLRAAGRTGEAGEAYRKAIDVSQNTSSAHRGLGIILFQQGELESSRRAFEKALELNPYDAQSLTNIGVIHATGGKTDEAVGYFKRALEINPENVIARNNLQSLSDSSSRTPTLCLLMIVRNERENLVELLPELAPQFDEIVIADTGSDDDTVAIARRFTDKIFSFPWDDDFSSARNFALANAHADWILWLDADDRIKPEDISLLRRQLGETMKGYFLRVLSGSADSGRAEFLQLRLFPNIKGIGWEGRIHEQIAPSLQRRGVKFKALPNVTIVHRGYEDSTVLREKTLRNATLLEKELAQKPNDLNILHHLGQAYALLGNWKKAIDVTEKLVQLQPGKKKNELLVHGMICLAQYHLLEGDDETAEQWASRVLEIEPDNLLVRYFLGEILYRRGAFEEAINWLEQFCEGRELVGSFPIPWQALKANARNYLGFAYERLGNHAKARSELRRAIEQGAGLDARKNLARICLAHGDPVEATSVLRGAVELESRDIELWIDLGVALARSRKFNEAAEAFRKALEIDPENSHARSNLTHVQAKLSPSPDELCKLSLNMIVRDEEKNLKEGLAPIADLFDEVVVGDTGSCDNTAQVAEQLGARVIRMPWRDNFAEARNGVLKESKGEWVFWLDADDRIEPDAVEILRKIIAKGIPCGVFFPLESRIGEKGSVVKNYTLRLFPNKPGIVWTGAVHEQVADNLRSAGVELVNCLDLTIRHIGYQEEGEALKKNVRNLNLLARELAARPGDPHVLFSLAQSFLFCGQVEHAAKWLRLLWGMRGKTGGVMRKEIFWAAAIVLSDCAMRSNSMTEAEAWLQHAIELSPDNWLAHFLLGEKKLVEGDLEHATELLEKAEKIGIGPTILPLEVEAIRGKLGRYLSRLKETTTSAI